MDRDSFIQHLADSADSDVLDEDRTEEYREEDRTEDELRTWIRAVIEVAQRIVAGKEDDLPEQIDGVDPR